MAKKRRTVQLEPQVLTGFPGRTIQLEPQILTGEPAGFQLEIGDPQVLSRLVELQPETLTGLPGLMGSQPTPPGAVVPIAPTSLEELTPEGYMQALAAREGGSPAEMLARAERENVILPGIISGKPSTSIIAQELQRMGEEAGQGVPAEVTRLPSSGEETPPAERPAPAGLPQRPMAGGGAAGRISRLGQRMGQLPGEYEQAAESYQEFQRAAEEDVAARAEERLWRQAMVQEASNAAVQAAAQQIGQEAAVGDIIEGAQAKMAAQQEKLAQLQQEYDEMQPGEIDPLGRFGETGPKVMAALGIIFGGLGSMFTGGPNQALDMVLNIAESDVSREQEERAAKRRALGERWSRQMEYMDRVRQMGEDEIEGKLLQRREIMAALDMKLRQIKGTSATQEKMLQAQELRTALVMKQNENEFALKQHKLKLEADALGSRIQAESAADVARRGWATIGIQREAQRGQAKLASVAQAQEVTQVQKATETIRDLQKQYNLLPSQIPATLSSLVPFITTDAKKYKAAIEATGRPIYRSILKDRMSDADAAWAVDKMFGQISEPRGVGNARFEATLGILDSIAEGKDAGLEAAGVVPVGGGQLKLDRRKFEAWLERVQPAE